MVLLNVVVAVLLDEFISYIANEKEKVKVSLRSLSHTSCTLFDLLHTCLPSHPAREPLVHESLWSAPARMHTHTHSLTHSLPLSHVEFETQHTATSHTLQTAALVSSLRVVLLCWCVDVLMCSCSLTWCVDLFMCSCVHVLVFTDLVC